MLNKQKRWDVAARTLVWGGGALFSTMLIWVLSVFFANSIVPVQWDDELGLYVPMEGITTRFRSEGWADTVRGSHGLTRAGEQMLRETGPTTLLWGDSFAEALQVEESERIAGVYNKLSKKNKIVTVAGGGLGAADYYFNIPRYERLGGNINGHIILLVGMDDVSPKRQVDCHSRFLADPWRFEASSCEPSSLALRFAPLFSRWNLEFLHLVYRSLLDYQFRFTPGPVQRVRRRLEQSLDVDMEEGWEYLVESLKERASGNLVFVYAPRIPVLRDGLVVLENGEEARKELFRDICVKNGVGFVDVSDAFIKLYADEGRLPRGFSNSPPGTGHMNEYGQAIIAGALYEYLNKEKP